MISMKRPPQATTLALLALAALPAGAESARHPLDPQAPTVPLAVENPFATYVPLLERDAPQPSFAAPSLAADEPSGAAELAAGGPHAMHGADAAPAAGMPGHGAHAGHGGAPGHAE